MNFNPNLGLSFPWEVNHHLDYRVCAVILFFPVNEVWRGRSSDVEVSIGVRNPYPAASQVQFFILSRRLLHSLFFHQRMI